MRENNPQNQKKDRNYSHRNLITKTKRMIKREKTEMMQTRRQTIILKSMKHRLPEDF